MSSYEIYQNKVALNRLRKFIKQEDIPRSKLLGFLKIKGEPIIKGESTDDIIKRISSNYGTDSVIAKLKKIKIIPRKPKGPSEPLEKIQVKVQIKLTVSDKKQKGLRMVNVNEQLGIDHMRRSDINKLIYDACEAYTFNISNCEYKIVGQPHISIYKKVPQDKKVERFLTTKMREVVPLNIDNLLKYASIKINMLDANCVRSLLLSKYPKHKAAIMKLGNENGVTNEELYNFCVKYHIKMYARNLEGTVVIENKPEVNSKMSRLIYIYYNNHIYPQASIPEVYKNKNKYDQIVYVENCKQELIRLLDSGEVPVNVSAEPIDNENKAHGIFDATGAKIKSFTHKKVCYTGNEFFEESKAVLKLFGLEDKITPDINHNAVMAIIEKKYNGDKVKLNSFLPNHTQFIKAACAYTTSKIDKKRSKITIDKNSCYAWVLTQLPFIPSCNLMQHSIKTEFTPDYKIVDENMYIAVPVKTNNFYHRRLMPDENLYNGYYLNLLKNEIGVQFTLKECIKGNKSKNIYTKMINDILALVKKDKISNSYAKLMFVKYIGCTELSTDIKIVDVFKNIYNTEDIESCDGYTHKINKDYHISYETKQIYNTQTKKPLGIFIKDMTKYYIYKKLISVGLKPEDIVQIYTDSITFYTDNLKNFNIEDHISSAFDGWKIEDEFVNHNIKECYMFPRNVSFSKNHKPVNNKNQLIKAPAGSGKTFHIINDIIPKLGHSNYIVLLPTHDTRADYAQANIKSNNVYHKYIFANTIPSEQVIIIDEVGLYDYMGQLLIYKCGMAGKQIICVGDFDQLLPIKETSPFNNQVYLDSIFPNISTLDQNMRNNFTKAYYKDLKTNQDTDYLTKEVLKYNTKNYYDADMIITYYRKSRDKYNELMLEHLGFESKFDKGVKLQCITNDLYTKHEITNRMCFQITTVTKWGFELTDTVFNKIYKLSKKEISKYFRPAYAKTLYSIQGKSVKSYFYPKEDSYQIDNRSAYTIISRIKEELKE